MKNHRKIWKKACLAGMLLTMSGGTAVSGESLSTVTEEAQILPIPDGSGCYLLKSDGFYCLKANGSRDGAPGIHYFDHLVIDGTLFDGYYYHDETGRFSAHAPEMAYIKKLAAPVREEEPQLVFDGFYMVGNLGKLSAAPQVRYMDGLSLNGVSLQGYYYFNENGRLVQEAGVHEVRMDSRGRHFDGHYYFGGPDGLLSEEGGVTADGLVYDEEGRVENMEEEGREGLLSRLEAMTAAYEGEWSIYVKDLGKGKDMEILINDRPLCSASLIKLFVMEATYHNGQDVKSSLGLRLKADTESDPVAGRLGTLLTNMITVSDNESFNELVRLQTEDYHFALGARRINRYLRTQGYEDTAVLHTLAPSPSTPVGIGENNQTSAKDCGRLLERIYRGRCVSREASEAMEELLLAQRVTTKIPQPLGGEVKVANKTGETDTDQHDVAIVYGEKTDYILCVLSENCPKKETAIENIRNISRVVYEYLNQ